MKKYLGEVCIAGGVYIMIVAVAVLAGGQQNDEEYSKKQWSMALRLEGNSSTIINMVLSLPSKPVSINGSGEAIIHDAYFYRENDKAGNPNLGVLFQISDSSRLKTSVIYNANKKGEK